MTESADRIRALAGKEDLQRATVQSVLAVTEAAVARGVSRELGVQRAALSLGQQEMVGALVGELRGTQSAVAHLRSSEVEAVPEQEQGGTWWFALSEATQGFETDIDRLSALVGAQPKGSTARELVGIVLRQLREHHRLLLGEASRWIEG